MEVNQIPKEGTPDIHAQFDPSKIFNEKRDLFVFQNSFLHRENGERVIQLEPGFIQDREPHFNKVEGSIEYRTEKGGSKKVIHEE